MKLNAATRLVRILTEASVSKDDKSSAFDVWAKIFDINERNPIKRAVLTTQLLSSLQSEVDHAIAGMARLDVPSSIYETHFTRAQNAASPLHLPSPWSNVLQYLPRDTMTALEIFAHMLPDEEDAISEDDAKAIRDCVRELKSALEEGGLPERLRSLIAHHVELIERALAEYRITGATALREAAHTAYGEMVDAKDVIAESKSHPAVERLSATWKKIVTVTDAALKVDKLHQLGQRVIELLSTW